MLWIFLIALILIVALIKLGATVVMVNVLSTALVASLTFVGGLAPRSSARTRGMPYVSSESLCTLRMVSVSTRLANTRALGGRLSQA